MPHKILSAFLFAAIATSPALADRQAQRAKDIAAGEAKLAELTKGLVPGKPLNCLPSERWTDSQNIDHVGILYGFGSHRYLGRLDPDCADFSFTDIPVIVSHGMTCQGDIVRIVDSASRFPKGSCVFRGFIPYDRPAKR